MTRTGGRSADDDPRAFLPILLYVLGFMGGPGARSPARGRLAPETRSENPDGDRP